MTTDNPQQPQSPHKQVDDLLSSPDLVRAVEDQDFKRFLDHVPVAIAVSRSSSGRPRICYANAAFGMLSGYEPTDIQTKDWDILAAFAHEMQSTATLARAAASGEDFLGTFRREVVGAMAVVVQAYAATIENEDGTENYRVVALVDVSHIERAHSQEYERKIRDQDLLLKELQHRVKNNLQLITALIRLESRNVKRTGAPADLEPLAGRIEALSLLYQMLQADSFGPEFDLGLYLSQIASAFMRAHAIEGIKLKTSVSYSPVSVNVGMPVGLIVNELLVNAFKYAFGDREGGVIELKCKREGEDSYQVVVADDGIGLPPGLTWPAPNKLAALIVQTLHENAKDVRLTVDTAPHQGTRVTVNFRHIPPSARTN